MSVEFLLLVLLLLLLLLIDGLQFPSQLAAMYFIPVPSLSIYQSSFFLGCHSPIGTTS
jgi:hypothetical protein